MRRTVAFWLLSAAGLALVGFLAGRALHSGPGQEFAFDTEGPAYTNAAPVAAFSKGGFTGFGEVQGFEGSTVQGGRIVETDDGSITVETAAGVRSTVRLENSSPLQVIRPGGQSELRSGVTVYVRPAPDGDQAEAILVVSTDLSR